MAAKKLIITIPMGDGALEMPWQAKNLLCRMLVNGQIPDHSGVISVRDDNGVWRKVQVEYEEGPER